MAGILVRAAVFFAVLALFVWAIWLDGPIDNGSHKYWDW